MVKVLYKLFLALMIALFVGFGISVFYTSPKAPNYPIELQSKSPDSFTAEQNKVNDEYNQQQKVYQDQFPSYSRNVSAIAIGVSIILLILGLTFLIGIGIIGDGVLFGGLFTLVYGIIRGFMSEDSKYQFIVVTIGLIIALALGYIKFIAPEKRKNK